MLALACGFILDPYENSYNYNTGVKISPTSGGHKPYIGLYSENFNPFPLNDTF